MTTNERRRLKHYVSLLIIAANEVRVGERDDDDEGLRNALGDLQSHARQIESLLVPASVAAEVPKP